MVTMDNKYLLQENVTVYTGYIYSNSHIDSVETPIEDIIELVLRMMVTFNTWNLVHVQNLAKR